MSDDLVPPHMEAALRTFRDAIAETRTRRIRLESIEIPDVDGPTPDDMDEAARRPDAPAELRAVARAVDEGRATWDDVLHARPGAAPEVQALYDASGPRFEALLEAGAEEDRRRAEQGLLTGDPAEPGVPYFFPGPADPAGPAGPAGPVDPTDPDRRSERRPD